MKDVRVFNLSLLAKWKRRLIHENQYLWQRVLGRGRDGRLGLSDEAHPRLASRWWKELCGPEEGIEFNWFKDGVTRKVGNGRSTSFWLYICVGNSPLCVGFPHLFSISNQKEAMVGDMWRSSDGVHDWLFSWRRRLFIWEEGLLNDLMMVLQSNRGGQAEDGWWWSPEEGGFFWVKSSYNVLLERLVLTEESNMVEEAIFKVLWKSATPSKVIAFSFALLLDRIPTRSNLLMRNVLPSGGPVTCVWCNVEVETSNHVFLHCEAVKVVWIKICLWLELSFISLSNLFSHIEGWRNGGNSNKLKRVYLLIWNAVIWSIWTERNNRIFNDEVVEGIKLLSWHSLLSRLKIASCLFYEWCWNPKDFLRR